MGNFVTYTCEPFQYPFFSLAAALACESSGGFPPVHFLWPFSIYIYTQRLAWSLLVPLVWEVIEAIARALIDPGDLTMHDVFPGYENMAGGLIFDGCIQNFWGVFSGYLFVYVTQIPCEPLSWSSRWFVFAAITVATTSLQALIMSFYSDCGVCHWLSSGGLAILFTLSFYAYLKFVCAHPKNKPKVLLNPYPIWLIVLLYGLVQVVCLFSGSLLLEQSDWKAIFSGQGVISAGLAALAIERAASHRSSLDAM